MPTSSITKDFIIRSQEAYDRLMKAQEETRQLSDAVIHPTALERGRMKLAKFAFADESDLKNSNDNKER